MFGGKSCWNSITTHYMLHLPFCRTVQIHTSKTEWPRNVSEVFGKKQRGSMVTRLGNLDHNALCLMFLFSTAFPRLDLSAVDECYRKETLIWKSKQLKSIMNKKKKKNIVLFKHHKVLQKCVSVTKEML